MSTIQNSQTPATVPTDSTTPFTFGRGTKLMSPEQIMAYVALAMKNIGSQLQYYQEVMEDRQKKADALNKALAFARGLQPGSEGVGIQGWGHNGAQMTQKQYDTLMQTLEPYLDDPAVKSAYDRLLGSAGGYNKAGGGWEPALPKSSTADNNGGLSGAEWTKSVTSQLEEALKGLNSENEMLMLNLQTLMQQRNQISQFASNTLQSIHESTKSILGNLRA